MASGMIAQSDEFVYMPLLSAGRIEILLTRAELYPSYYAVMATRLLLNPLTLYGSQRSFADINAALDGSTFQAEHGDIPLDATWLPMDWITTAEGALQNVLIQPDDPNWDELYPWYYCYSWLVWVQYRIALCDTVTRNVTFGRRGRPMKGGG